MPLILNATSFSAASQLLKNDIHLEDSDININMTREIAVQMMRTLISQSAHEIVLVWNDRSFERLIMSDFPIMLKRRIKSIYLTDIPSEFLSLFEPICNEQIFGPALDTLLNEIYFLYMASKERTEVDIISSFNILINWNNIFHKSEYLKSSTDVLNLISLLMGLINSYRYSENIECFIDNNQDIPIEKRIEDFLSDAYVNNLSKEKYFFGIPSRAKQSILNYRRMIADKFVNRMEFVIKPFFFASLPIELNIMGKNTSNYSPPIAPLRDIYMSEINEYILNRDLKRLYFVETMPTYRSGFTCYECNGNDFKPSLIASGLDIDGEYCLGGINWVNIDVSHNKIRKLDIF